MSDRVHTIGHSTHDLEAFVALLARHGVGRLVDVRRFPSSRRLPHFNREPLATALGERGIDYAHIEALGGRRRPVPGSPNGAWRVEGFRGYADHMATEEFAAGLERLERLARERPTAYMCAEADVHRCHRRLTSDALVARGWWVGHIGPRGEVRAHELTPWAVVEGDRVAYPPVQGELGVP